MTTMTVLEIEVAEHRQQADEEGHDDHGFGERQLHAECGQYGKQVNPGQQRIQRRDAHLREHHAAEGIAQALHPFAHGLRQRRQRLVRARFAQRDKAADDQADDEMQQRTPGVAAVLANLQRMGAQPFDQPGAYRRVVALRQPGRRPRRQQFARVLDDFGHLAQQTGDAALAAQVQDHAGGESPQRAQHDQRDERHHQHLGPHVVEPPDDDARRQQMHQLHHQEARQQAGQQMEFQGEQQSCRHQQPGGDLIAAGGNDGWLDHGRHSAKQVRLKQAGCRQAAMAPVSSGVARVAECFADPLGGAAQRLGPARLVAVGGGGNRQAGDQLALGVTDRRADAGHPQLGFLAVMRQPGLADGVRVRRSGAPAWSGCWRYTPAGRCARRSPSRRWRCLRRGRSCRRR